MRPVIRFGDGIVIFKPRIYFGRNSVVGLDPQDNKVDTIQDYVYTTFGCLIDLSDHLNQNAVLTHFILIKDNQQFPILKDWNKGTVYGRLKVLAYNLPSIYKIFNRSYIARRLREILPSLNNLSNDEIKRLMLNLAVEFRDRLNRHKEFNIAFQRITILKQRGVKVDRTIVERWEALFNR